jgi:hypothetical protein
VLDNPYVRSEQLDNVIWLLLENGDEDNRMVLVQSFILLCSNGLHAYLVYTSFQAFAAHEKSQREKLVSVGVNPDDTPVFGSIDDDEDDEEDEDSVEDNDDVSSEETEDG